MAVAGVEGDSLNDLVVKVQALLLFLGSVTDSQTVLSRSEVIIDKNLGGSEIQGHPLLYTSLKPT